MCTVTYLPLGNQDFILTSNRDENPKRNTIPPKEYLQDGVKLIYPKDELAGGTWIGISEKKHLICLLNGGFVKHKRTENYRMSRGVIVKELLKVDNPVAVIKDFNFDEIEPFTIVLITWKKGLNAYELVWNGTQKYFKKLADKPEIWSSSTLYTPEMKELRRGWFSEWIAENPTFLAQEKIIEFHKDETKGTAEISLKMKRARVETVSITSVLKKGDEVIMNYHPVA